MKIMAPKKIFQQSTKILTITVVLEFKFEIQLFKNRFSIIIKDTTTASAPVQLYSSSEISTTATIESSSLQTPHITEKYSEIPMTVAGESTSSTFPTPDPYFTHFDPRMEHQSYKVKQNTFFTIVSL